MSSFDVCIICALPKEATAVIEALKEDGAVLNTATSSQGHDYQHTTIRNDKDEEISIFVTWLSRMGPRDMQRESEWIIQEFQPKFAIMTGICAGNSKKVNLGDLVVAESTFSFDVGKIVVNPDTGEAEPQYDIRTEKLPHNILHFLGMFHDWETLTAKIPRPPSLLQQSDWLLKTLLDKKTVDDIADEELQTHAPDIEAVINHLQKGPEPFLSRDLDLIDTRRVARLRLKRKFPYIDAEKPQDHIGVMASSGAVHEDNPFANITKAVRTTLAIDMEGATFYYVAYDSHKIPSLLVKGVCDYADSDKNDNYQEYAAKLSAVYALAFIKAYVNSERIPALGSRKTPVIAPTRPVESPVTKMETAVKMEQAQSEKQPLKIFISFSQSEKDNEWRIEFEKHFAIKKKNREIVFWHRNNIEVGAGSVDQQIQAYLDQAKIILLFITPDYIATDFYADEIEYIENLYKKKQPSIVPILVRQTTGWEEEFYKPLLILPRNTIPIANHSNRDEALTIVAREIEAVIKTVKTKMQAGTV